MKKAEIQKYQSDTELTNYYPLPRSLLKLDLPSTALLLYSVLLDRATLSRKNGYTDGSGWVYVIYPIENLAQTLAVCPSMVKKHLRILEDTGLIRRIRPSGNGASQIYLNLPADSIKALTADQKGSAGGAKSGPSTGKKVPANNVRKQQKLTDSYYQHREDESL